MFPWLRITFNTRAANAASLAFFSVGHHKFTNKMHRQMASQHETASVLCWKLISCILVTKRLFQTVSWEHSSQTTGNMQSSSECRISRLGSPGCTFSHEVLLSMADTFQSVLSSMQETNNQSKKAWQVVWWFNPNQQLSTKQLTLIPSSGWGGESEKRQIPWVEIRTVP